MIALESTRVGRRSARGPVNAPFADCPRRMRFCLDDTVVLGVTADAFTGVSRPRETCSGHHAGTVALWRPITLPDDAGRITTIPRASARPRDGTFGCP